MSSSTSIDEQGLPVTSQVIGKETRHKRSDSKTLRFVMVGVSAFFFIIFVITVSLFAVYRKNRSRILVRAINITQTAHSSTGTEREQARGERIRAREVGPKFFGARIKTRKRLALPICQCRLELCFTKTGRKVQRVNFLLLTLKWLQETNFLSKTKSEMKNLLSIVTVTV